MNPSILTLAEVDEIAARFKSGRLNCCYHDDGWRCEHYDAAALPDSNEVASLLRMARALAVANEGAATLEWIGEDDWICTMYAHEGGPGEGATAIEAIEAADATMARAEASP